MITCSDIRGVPCSQLLPPSGICSIGEEIVALTFAITSSTCEDSRTSQDQSFECQGVENLPREGTVVVVSCQDSSGQEFYNDTAPVGASVTIQGPAATGLPDVVTCIIANESPGNQLQSLTFDTSGSVDLLLRDKFGMMELISCDVSGQPLQNCNVPVLFSYELENNGALDLNVTSLTRIRDGQNASLIDSIERANPLSPGDIVSTTEAEDLDLCVDGAYQTTIIVGASQLAGEFCEFVATYGIDISSPCRIDIDIDCTSEDEIPCNQFPLLDTLCPTNLEFLTFKYLSSPCPGENGVTTCEDFNGGLVGGQISVSCAGSDGVSIGIPATVVNQDIFTIDLSGTSPTQLTCTLTSMDSTTLQVISLDLTDGSALTLTSIFGGLTLDGCGDAAGVALSCTTAVSWNFETINIGSNDLNLTSIEIVRDDGTIDLSEQIVNRFIAPGDSIHAKYEELVDRCMGLTTTARVSGEISGQVLCLSEEVYEFETISGPGSPTAGPVTSSPTAANTPVAPMPTPMAESTTAPSQTSVVSTISPTPSMPATPEEPSLAPSELPAHSSSPPTENCIVVEIDCLPPFEGANCNDIVVEIIECQEPPSEMVLRYNGGDCDGSFNIQPDTLFSCVDLQGGPPQEVGAVSYITARGLGENQEEYFSGFVAIGEDFVLSAQTVVTANMNIMIYDPSGSSNPDEITNSDGLVQNITMHTSCLNYLFLKDRFGAVQLVEFENSRQGRVTSYQNITLTYTIELARNQEEVSVELTGLTVTSNIEISEGETRDVSPAVIEKIVTPDMTVTIEEQYRIDLTQRKRYTTSAVVVGQADDGKICSGSESYQFTAGNPLPPIFPTLSPSSPPTISPFPTPDPLNATCEVQASIACALTSGRRCNLQAPAGSTCIGSDANFLQFMYAPDSFCNRTSTATNFICDDSNIDIERPQTVYIRIGRGDEEAWFSDVVSTGQVIDVSIPVGESMRIEISTDGGGVAGVLLQESLMSVTCVEESALTLLNYFGNLQLVGYQNLERGLQQVFANVEITYTATNVGALDMDLLGAFGSSPFTGFQQFLGAESQRLSRDESSSFVEEFTLNLAATAGSDFQFTFLAQGRGSDSQVGCDDTAAFTLAIQ